MNNLKHEQLMDRLRGIAVGAVVGDALGMPLEFLPPRDLFDLETEMRSGPLPAGTFTDDTEMALALAESLLLVNPLDPQDLVARFVGWYLSGPPDVGIHTAHVLRQVAQGTLWQTASKNAHIANPESAGNGALMRQWPLVIARWNNPSLLVAESRLQCETTHRHPDCINASIFYSLILQKLIQRDLNLSPDAAFRQAIAASLDQVDLGDEFRTVINLAPVRSRADLRNSGYVRHTMESALWAILTTRSFEEALVQAVNLGWDADTSGTVTGAMAGVLYGLESIPQRWKEAVHGEYPIKSGKLWFLKDVIKQADELSKINQ